MQKLPFQNYLRVVAAVVATGGWGMGLRGEVVQTGDVTPAIPSDGTHVDTVIIGDTGVGSVTVNAGSLVRADVTHLGDYIGGSGTVTLQDVGSAWIGDGLDVGWLGSGDFNLLNGASASIGGFSLGLGGSGTLSIAHGGSFNSGYGEFGVFAGASGTMFVDGTGSIWNYSSDFGGVIVGSGGNGTLNITNGGSVSITAGFPGDISDSVLGLSAGATGNVLVDGTGSSWSIAGNLYVGKSGVGHLRVTNGGRVIVSGNTYVAADNTSVGTIDFGSQGGTLTTGSLYVSPNQVSGTGNIITHGIVSDVDLAIDEMPGSRRLVWNGSGQNITVDVDVYGSGSSAFDLGVGYQGTGTLRIWLGAYIVSATGYLGYKAGSTGTATVGAGYTGFTGSTTWSTTTMVVGNYGTGILNISDGGQVRSNDVTVGSQGGSAGAVTVDGTTSKLTLTGILLLGGLGNGALTVSHGGQVTVAKSTLVASGTRGTGSVTFGVGGGSITTQSLYTRGPSQFSGTGSVKTNGLVMDGDLVFDATHGRTRTFVWNGPGQNVTVALDFTGASGAVGDLGSGYEGTGTLAIAEGVSITSLGGYLGYKSGSKGTASVSGEGTVWNTSGDFHIGLSGMGVLNISAGGTVANSSTSRIASSPGGIGTVTVDGAGSKWNIKTLEVGNKGTGTLNVLNGGAVTNSGLPSYLGTSSGDGSGSVTVDGAGSKWTAGVLYVGDSGTGALNVQNSGALTATNIQVGFGKLNVSTGGSLSANGLTVTSSEGKVSVMGSTITISSLTLQQGMVIVAQGGKVSFTGSSTGSINTAGLLAVNVGDGSSMNFGNGKLTNNGTLRLRAVAGLMPGTYTPITASTWSGSGAVQALGGSWNSTTHEFVVSAAASGNVRQGVTIDRALTQRVMITDAAGDSVWAGFQGTTSSSSLTFTADLLTGPQAALLGNKLSTGQTLLAGWNFTTSGYTAVNPVLLSLSVGPGLAGQNLAIWHYDGKAWTPFVAGDLTYDGTYANFTVTGFSGYGVTGVSVPEPYSLGVLGLGGMFLLMRRRGMRNV